MTPEEKIEILLHEIKGLSSTKKFNWENHSYLIPKYCSEHFNSKKYNWEDHSWAVAEYCPNKIDPKLYNWKDASWAIPMYCPEKLDPNLYNWEESSSTLLFRHPNHKYIHHCIYKKNTIENLKSSLYEYKEQHHNYGFWTKYTEQLNDLLDPIKRKRLLKKVSKEKLLERI